MVVHAEQKLECRSAEVEKLQLVMLALIAKTCQTAIRRCSNARHLNSILLPNKIPQFQLSLPKYIVNSQRVGQLAPFTKFGFLENLDNLTRSNISTLQVCLPGKTAVQTDSWIRSLRVPAAVNHEESQRFPFRIGGNIKNT